MTGIDTERNIDTGNYMTVIKCIWGNLVLKSTYWEKEACVMKPYMRDTKRKIGQNNRIDKHEHTENIYDDRFILGSMDKRNRTESGYETKNKKNKSK